MKKLVRDNIPRIMMAQGKDVDIEICRSTAEKIAYLAQKIVEEAAELHDAIISAEHFSDTDSIINEMADVMEVLYAIQSEINISQTEVHQAQVNKRDERGSFYSGFLLEVPDKD